MKAKSGFSLIEIIVVLAIVGGLSYLSIDTYRKTQQQADLRAAVSEIIETLRTARERTLASVNDSRHGVHFAASEYVLFQGDAYSPSSPFNQTFAISDALAVSDIQIGGGTDVVFDRVTGRTTNAGSITINVIDYPYTSEVINVSASGQVGLLATREEEDTRVTDSRHVHLDMGWGIGGSNELRLTFHDPPNPDVIETVQMADYFSTEPDAFDWEGTFTIYGESQRIRISTVMIDAFDTILNIHRDLRFNTKPVTVSIDGKNIINYDDTGGAEAGMFGGTLIFQ